MTTRNKRSLTEITGDVESAQQYPSLGEPPSLAATASVDQLSHDDLKSALLELGYELHQKRKQKSAVTQKEEVEGKKAGDRLRADRHENRHRTRVRSH